MPPPRKPNVPAPPKAMPLRAKLVEAITTPLGFFVLALLIVEAFLGTVMVWAELEPASKITGMWMGVGLFILVVVIVGLLVFLKPENLTFDKDAHLVDRGKVPYGSNQKQLDATSVFTSEKKEEQQ